MSAIAQEMVEKYLWGAANFLRGHIDAGDYKQFIFPLLFYKRICDVYDEEYVKALAESDGDLEYARFAEIHRFQIPDGAHWTNIREATKNVGTVLQRAMRTIETANQDTLYGIFGDAQWTNKERLSDATLIDLIEHFSSMNLTLEDVPQDQLGESYEYLIKKFADDSGHTAAEFYTNRTLVRLMTLILDPQPDESIYDPTCGSGGMLLIASLQIKEQKKEYRGLKLYGQEVNLITSAIARMNLFLHGIEDFTIIRGDTLSRPAFIEHDKLQQFDVVLANPPYSLSNWDRGLWIKDPYGRNFLGVPPQGRADYAFFQHIIKSMNIKTGRCAILFPHGVLFRDEEQKMRKKLVNLDIIDCILGLGPNLFYNSPMEACIIFCKMKKPLEKQGKIFFINAVNEVRKERSNSYLEDQHIKKITHAYREFKDVDKFSKVVTIDEIRKNDFNLNMPLYVLVSKGIEAQSSNNNKTHQELMSEWIKSSKSVKESITELFDDLEEIGVG